MSIIVMIPRPLHQYSGGQKAVEVTGDTVALCLEDLTAQFPALKKKVYNEQGEIAHYIHISLNEKKASAQEPVKDGDELSILLAIAGG